MNQHDDLAFMQDPDKWPHWPSLPLKRRDLVAQKVTLGVMREVGLGVGKYIFCENANLFGTADAKWRDVTPQQLIEEGWVVD